MGSFIETARETGYVVVAPEYVELFCDFCGLD